MRSPRPTFQISRCRPTPRSSPDFGRAASASGTPAAARLPRPIAALGTNNTTLLFSRDGQHLFAGTRAGEIQVWSLSQEKTVQTLRGPAEPVRQLRQDALGRSLFAVQRTNSLLLDGPCQLQVWNTATGQPQAPWPLPRLPFACALSPDGRRLATGHFPGVVLVWDLMGGLRTNRLAFAGGISDLAFSPDGRYLAASTQEGFSQDLGRAHIART